MKPNGDVQWPAPHDGFELEATAPGATSLGTNVRVVAYGNGHGRGYSVVVADDTQEPPFAQLFGDTRIVNLRGTQGIVGSRVNGPSYGVRPDMVFDAEPQLTMEWLEYPNIEIAVAGAGMTEQQLLQIAASVHEVAPVEWARLGGTPAVVGSATAPDAATNAAITHAFAAWLDGAHPTQSGRSSRTPTGSDPRFSPPGPRTVPRSITRDRSGRSLCSTPGRRR